MACEKMPYFSAALHALTPCYVPKGSLGSFGVTKTGILLVDEEALEKWNVPQIAGVLVHEALHIIRDHHSRGARLKCAEDLWNTATDCEIDDDLKAAHIKLPETACYPDSYKLPTGQTAEFYYDELLRKAKQCPSCSSQEGQGQGQDPVQKSGQGQGQTQGQTKGKGQKKNNSKKSSGQPKCPRCESPDKPTATGGWCGSGGGHPVPGEPIDEADDQTKGGRSEAELNALRKRVAEEIQQATSKQPGTVPAGLARWATDYAKPAKINWRAKLARLTRNAMGYRPGAVDFRYHRPSRRQAAFGYGLGHPILPALVRPVPKCAIAVDTSGSMSGADLAVAVRESLGILQAVGAQVTFLSCDTKVSAVREVHTAKAMMATLQGGGGTSFLPIFDAISKVRPRPEILIVATDGWGPAPKLPLHGVHTIWLLIGKNSCQPMFPAQPWGAMVQVDDL
jgi:predicted metal-dependent peptidase